MLALSDLIDFLLDLLRDEDVRAEFEQDPDAVLAERGLDGVTAQDVRDARLVLADDGGIHVDAGGHSSSGGDAVREIHHTTAHYSAGDVARPADDGRNLVDQGTTIVTIDDRDTVTIISDSFNSDDDVTTVDIVSISDVSVDNRVDSSVDNSVDNSVTDTDVVAIDADNSFNEDIDTDVVAIDADNSFNEGDSTDIGLLEVGTTGAPEEPDEAPDVEEPEPTVEIEPDGAELDAAVV